MNNIKFNSNNSDIGRSLDIKTTLNSIKDTPINNLTKISSPVESNNSFSFKSIIIRFFLFVIALIILPFLRIGGMQLFHLEGDDPYDKSLPKISSVIKKIFIIYITLTIILIFFYYIFAFDLSIKVN